MTQHSPTSGLAAALATITVMLTACSAHADNRASAGDDSPPQSASAYVGDPWERRHRQQFWADQHIHDSWNPCHLGENVPKAMQQRGPQCYARLR